MLAKGEREKYSFLAARGDDVPRRGINLGRFDEGFKPADERQSSWAE